MGRIEMFQMKNSIAASLALVVFLTSSVAFAEGDSSTATAKTDTAATTAKTDTATAMTDTVKATQKKQPKKKRSKTAPKSVAPKTDTSAPPSNASAPSTPLKTQVSASAPPAAIFEASGEDSAEAVKQRSGPGNPVTGKDKSELCQGCHGEEGVSPEGFAPMLAGQYGVYISKQLRNFQAGTRVHQIMSAIAATISDDDLADISAYFASRTKMKGEGSNNKLGKEIFLHGDMNRMMVACVNCHGKDGKGKSPTNPVFPVIGGQHKEYLTVQLIHFRAGDRSNSPGGIMNIITQKLTDAELEALADYVSGL
jgi:cytochrome c553